MRTIYVDSENKCHSDTDGTMTTVETDFFDGKCDTFIEGHCCEVNEYGTAIHPMENYNLLAAAQAQYELDLAEAAAAYQEGVHSVWT